MINIKVSMMAIKYKEKGYLVEDPKESKKTCTEIKKALKEAGVKMKKACVSEHINDVYGLDFWSTPECASTIYKVAIENGITNVKIEYRDIDQD